MVAPKPTRLFGDTCRVSQPGRSSVTFLGHATVAIDMDGVRVLTDPILRSRAGALTRVPDTPARELWADPDIVLVSHTHWDHLDYGSLRLLGMDVPIVIPRGGASELHRHGFHQVSEVVAGDEIEVGGLRIETVHAEHHGFGPPVGGTELAVGYLVHGSQSHYFAGDTAFFEGMAKLDTGLDLALMPVWGWGPTAKAAEHLDPMGAARAVAVIRPRLAIPIHWGTLHPVGMRWVRPSTRIDPPHQFAQLVRRLAPGTTVRVLPVGSTLQVPPATGAGREGRSR